MTLFSRFTSAGFSGLSALSAFTCLVSLGVPSAVNAQTYPNRPISWIVGYPPGGAVDFLARTLSIKMSSELGQPLVIDNKSGAAGIIAAGATARAPNDGYTIASSGNGELVFNPMLYKKLTYDAKKDFVSIGPVAKIPFLLAVSASLPVTNFGELIALARTQPGKINYASGGMGHPNHLSMEMLKSKFGVDFTNVPYKGMAPALQDFLSGAVPVMFIDLATATSQMNSGRFRILAVSTAERLDALPAIPTVAEVGGKAFDVFAWQALVAPTGTPPAVVARVNTALQQALKDPEVIKKFKDAGMQPAPGPAKALEDLVQSDRIKWAPVIEALNIKLD